MLRNVSEGSMILCPQNSTISEGKTVLDNLPPDIKQAFKHDEIFFTPQAYRADIQYERDHNQHCDFGVYREGANDEVFEDLAERTGLRDRTALDRKKEILAEAQAEIQAREDQRLEQLTRNKDWPEDWDKIDPKVDWRLPEYIEPTEYAEPFIIRGDIIFRVSRLGYKPKHILDDLYENKTSH